jgi:hypothetical protein
MMDSKTILEIKRLSESSYFVINKLSESMKLLATTRIDSPQFDHALQGVRMVNREADELLRKQQSMIRQLK